MVDLARIVGMLGVVRAGETRIRRVSVGETQRRRRAGPRDGIGAEAVCGLATALAAVDRVGAELSTGDR